MLLLSFIHKQFVSAADVIVFFVPLMMTEALMPFQKKRPVKNFKLNGEQKQPRKGRNRTQESPLRKLLLSTKSFTILHFRKKWLTKS